MEREEDEAVASLMRSLGIESEQEEASPAISLVLAKAGPKLKGFRERSYKAEKFFRVGKSGQWRTALSKTQVDRVCEAHKEQMERFGYWPL